MTELSDAATIAALRRQMTVAVARQVVSASNLANLDTPGYRTREIDFGSTLDGKLTGSIRLASTDPRHLAGSTVAAGADTRETTGLESRRDGNNVQLDHELLKMTQASSDFAKAQTALAAKFRLVRYALTEGR